MATVNPTTTFPTTHEDRKVRIVTWGPMLNTDVGAAIDMPGLADRSVQIEGTIGVGGTLLIEGSNDGVNFEQLRDPLGNALQFTAVGLKAILEAVLHLRPRVSAGDGTTSLTATLLIRG